MEAGLVLAALGLIPHPDQPRPRTRGYLAGDDRAGQEVEVGEVKVDGLHGANLQCR